MSRIVIPDNIRGELNEAVKERYPKLPLASANISKSGNGYHAYVTLINQSKEEDGTIKYHGTLGAVFEYHGQWRCTRDFED